MKKRLLTISLLTISILVLSSCKVEDFELKLMSIEEINNFVNNFEKEYKPNNYTYISHTADFFKTSKSGIINLIQEVNDETNLNPIKYLINAKIEYNLDRNYIYCNYTRKDTINNQEQIKNVESIYLKEGNIVKEYSNSNNNKTVCILNEEIDAILFRSINEYSGHLLDYSLLKISEFDTFYSSNKLNMHKTDNMFLADFEYIDNNNIEYTNKVTYNKDYLPVDANLIVRGNFSVKDTNLIKKFYNKSKINIKLYPVEIKSFDKNEYKGKPING